MAPESHDEVRQRIDSLYARAENDTGNFNATRAMAAASRRRGVPLAKRQSRGADPALDAVAKPWFDGARAKLGPTVPALLPADRRPAPSSRDQERDAGGRELTAPAPLALPAGSGDRAVPELTGATPAPALPAPRPPAELESGITGGPPARPAELPAAHRAELPYNGGALPLPGGNSPGLPAMPDPAAGMPLPTGFRDPEPAGLGTSGAGWPGATFRDPEPAGLGTSGAGWPGATFRDPEPAGLGTSGAGWPGATFRDPEPAGLGTSGAGWPGATFRDPEPAGLGTSGAGWPGATSATLPAPADALPTAPAPVTAPTATPAPPVTLVPPTAPAPAGVPAPVADQVAALSAPSGRPAAPGRMSPLDSKARTRSRLGAAREMLARHTAPAPAAQAPAPWSPEPQARTPQDTGQWQQPPWTSPSAPAPAATAAVPAPAFPASAADTGAWTYAAIPDAVTDTGSLAYFTTTPVTPASDTGSFPAVGSGPALDTGTFAAGGTGSFTYVAVPDTPSAPPAVARTGSFPRPASHAPESARAMRAAKAIAFAQAQLGKPCVWGATGPDSYDCASLTQGAWKVAGVVLPRSAPEQAYAGTQVEPGAIQPGDLVLFHDDDRHVGLYVGNGTMIHAPGPGTFIREEAVHGAGGAAVHRVIRPA